MPGLSGTIDIPHVGPVKKQTVVIVGAIGGGVVLYAWWHARSTAAAPAPADTGPTTTSGTDAFGADTGIGTVSGYDNSGSDTAQTGPTTNAEWTELVNERLAGAYDPTAIAAALGRYLTRAALSATDKEIVQAAIAAAGYPPEGGNYSLNNTVGPTKLTTAPTGLHVVGTTQTSVTLAWNKLEGAGYYRIYRSGASTNVGSTDGGNTSITISGLQPNTSYTFQIAGDTTADSPGPKSAGVKAKTQAYKLGAPTGLKATSIARTSIHVTCNRVTGATRYGWYVNGVAHGSSDAPTYDIVALKPNTQYSIRVAADNEHQAPGPQSGHIIVKTKK